MGRAPPRSWLGRVGPRAKRARSGRAPRRSWLGRVGPRAKRARSGRAPRRSWLGRVGPRAKRARSGRAPRRSAVARTDPRTVHRSLFRNGGLRSCIRARSSTRVPRPTSRQSRRPAPGRAAPRRPATNPGITLRHLKIPGYSWAAPTVPAGPLCAGRTANRAPRIRARAPLPRRLQRRVACARRSGEDRNMAETGTRPGLVRRGRRVAVRLPDAVPRRPAANPGNSLRNLQIPGYSPGRSRPPPPATNPGITLRHLKIPGYSWAAPTVPAGPLGAGRTANRHHESALGPRFHGVFSGAWRARGDPAKTGTWPRPERAPASCGEAVESPAGSRTPSHDDRRRTRVIRCGTYRYPGILRAAPGRAVPRRPAANPGNSLRNLQIPGYSPGQTPGNATLHDGRRPGPVSGPGIAAGLATTGPRPPPAGPAGVPAIAAAALPPRRRPAGRRREAGAAPAG